MNVFQTIFFVLKISNHRGTEITEKHLQRKLCDLCASVVKFSIVKSGSNFGRILDVFASDSGFQRILIRETITKVFCEEVLDQIDSGVIVEFRSAVSTPMDHFECGR